jgi:hypothetical protein
MTAAIPACKSDEAPTAKVSAASAPGGRVLEVSGTVTVAGKPLAKADTVAASAVIDTGADGNVVIELLHNLARWELGPNKHVRVDESLAWREPKRTEPAPQIDHAMSSAGRPAERMAADTAVTARDDSAQDKGSAAPAKPKDGIGLGGIGTIGHGAGTGTGKGYGAGNGSLGGGHQTKAVQVRPGDAQVSGQLPPEVIKRIVRQNFGRLRMCYETGLLANPTLSGKVVVKFVIGRDGAVSTAVDAGSSTIGDAKVVGCVVNAFTTLSFPAPADGIVTVTYPIVFSPGD